MASGVTRVVLRCQAAEDSKELGEFYNRTVTRRSHVTINKLNKQSYYWGKQRMMLLEYRVQRETSKDRCSGG